MQEIFRFYRLLNLLSIDVAVGAVVCVLFFAEIFNVHILPYGLLSLGLTVWVIYTADHLLDAKSIKKQASTERHRFHQQNFAPLTVALLLAILIELILIFFIRKPLLVSGLVLSTIVIGYFFIQRYLHFTKEIFAALLYCGGVLLAPLSLTDEILTRPHILLIIQFFFTALINLILFSWFDRKWDQLDDHHSFTNSVGEGVTFKLLALLLSVIISLSVYLIRDYPQFTGATSILFLMNMGLSAIFMFRKQLAIADRYRLLGEAVFFIPIFYLLT